MIYIYFMPDFSIVYSYYMPVCSIVQTITVSAVDDLMHY